MFDIVLFFSKRIKNHSNYLLEGTLIIKLNSAGLNPLDCR